MLHLWPVRWILTIAFALAALAILSAVYAGWIGKGDATADAVVLLRWSSIAAVITIALLFVVWRWIPPIQQYLFPYLGGRWVGHVEYEGSEGLQRQKVTLEVKHTPFGMRLLLDSKESISWTLLVHADKNQDFQRYRLYYAYLNERKEGFVNAGERYRGLAVIRVERATRMNLHGSYFTDTDRRGTIHLSLDAPHPWWMLWR